jgi:hypothetical protein
MTGRAAAFTALCACLIAACGGDRDSTPVLKAQPAAATPPSSGAAMPHGDHNPHYGGIVLMNGDQHFEAVLHRDGSARVYFSDAMRNELPAATASEVTIAITQKSQPPEVVAMRIDDSGESWVGRGHPVTDPAATARISYTSEGKPYFIDVPFPK